MATAIGTANNELDTVSGALLERTDKFCHLSHIVEQMDCDLGGMNTSKGARKKFCQCLAALPMLLTLTRKELSLKLKGKVY